MPRINIRYSDIRKELERYEATLSANAPELPHFDVPLQSIRNVLGVIRETSVEQDLHRANKQQAAKRHQAALEEGQKLITMTQVMLKQHYGNRSERLAEFGIQPFRSRPRVIIVEAKPQTPKAPEVPAVQKAKATDSES